MPMMNRMLCGLLLMVLAGCAGTGPIAINANHDPAADFTAFRTFAFMDRLDTDDRGGRSMLSMHLMTATTRELRSRGMQPVSGNPDLLVNFYMARDTGVASSNMSVSSAPFFHARTGYTTWSGYNVRTSTTSTITEGTILVDLVDAHRGVLVFEGSARGRITEAMADDRAGTAESVISKIFAELP